ncbi:dihydrolipoyl dehydrogenase family protein [Saliterribacillus persicus]|uniref:Glutathione reductase (NADPH) n=1 Tax=Saliterribacillus persicus TaxID=930114 RepID=A0A368Y6I1_9BACI|nr:NAD(P)/FAD-dependent oxidoreductase [Saliterribacillus persicus]RCW74936.1 glutathione reductase (NADPH) [Saliterribacillus persicus]
MVQSFDLIVVGTGSAGSTAANKCKKAGWSVAIIDSRPFGGTCALRGCDPKKVLVGAANIVEDTERMIGKGINQASSIQWHELMSFKKEFTSWVPEKSDEAFQDAGMKTFHGKASFVSENEIQVENDILRGEKILLANGATPTPLPIDGTEHLTYSDEFLDLEDLPEKIVFIGGGYISFEFAHIAARAGAKVDIIHRGEKPLKNFDSEQVGLLVDKSKEIGINVHLNTVVKSIKQREESYIVEGITNGENKQFDADIVVHGAGRIPAIDDLDLEKGNVKREEKGITVNEYLQSVSNPIVYSAGDAVATAGPPLTPIAGVESSMVASNLLKGNHNKPNYKGVPTVVFTLPKLASVGLSEDAAKEKGFQINVKSIDLSSWFTYKRTNQKYARSKVILDKDSNKILGAHLISEEADELINHFATAIQLELTAKELKKIILAYPTAASHLGSMME